MNNLSKFLGRMVLLTGVVAACPVSAASSTGGAVFQRTENTKSIELSNIDDEGAPQVPVAAETTVPLGGTKAAIQSPTKMPAQPTPPQVAKKKSAIGSVDDEDVAESEEPLTRQGQADANRLGDQDRNENVPAIIPANAGVATSSVGDVINSGGAGPTSSGTTSTSGGASTTAAPGTGTGTGMGTGTSAGAGNVPTVPSSPNAPTATSALDTKLEQYRNQMLQEVVNAQVTNPAITRRYQMMDKATYQSRGGL
jgi:hypothetical protein